MFLTIESFEAKGVGRVLIGLRYFLVDFFLKFGLQVVGVRLVVRWSPTVLGGC